MTKNTKSVSRAVMGTGAIVVGRIAVNTVLKDVYNLTETVTRVLIYIGEIHASCNVV